VGADGRIDRAVCLVFDLILIANERDDSSDLRIVNVANPREEVVDNLEVQSAEKPGEQAVLAPEIGSGPNLVNYPLGVDIFQQGRVLSLFHDVGQLEHYAGDKPQDHRHSEIGCHDNPPRVTQ
jgi:hypothetical protein